MASSSSSSSNPITTTNGAPTSSTETWEDIEKDVMVQVGQPDRSKESKQKRRRREDASALVDVKKKKENSFSRLEKKIGSKQTRRLVDEAAAHEQSLKARDKDINRW